MKDRKIVDYTVSDMDFSIIKELLNRGWQPYGSPFVFTSSFSGESGMYQAMVKYEDEK